MSNISNNSKEEREKALIVLNKGKEVHQQKVEQGTNK